MLFQIIVLHSMFLKSNEHLSIQEDLLYYFCFNHLSMFIIVKYLITAGFIVLASELAKSSDKLGALIISLPLMTILTLIWLQVE